MKRPDDIDFELVRTGEADAETEARVRAWPEHAAEVARLEALAEQARASAEATAEVSPAVKAAILDAATAAAERARRARRRRLLAWGAPVAAAATLLLAVLLRPSPKRAASPAAPAPGQGVATARPSAATEERAGVDINGDGRFDILDAFTLSRALDTGRVRPSWDLDGNARVDEADVDLLARRSVALGGPR